MANTRIKDLSNTATNVASDAFIAIDGSANGTEKISRDNLRQDTADALAAAPSTYNLAPLTSGSVDVDKGGTGSTTVAGAKTNLEIPTLGTAANEVPVNGMLNSGAWLDFDSHYSEGTWTPDLTFSGLKTGVAYTTQSGHYIKVGKSVTIHCHIVLTSAGSDLGNLRIDGLPFTSIAGQYSSGSVGYVTGMGAGGLTVTPTFLVNANSKEINFYKFGGNTVAKADVADNMHIRFSATYQIA